ncbi:hypothetical protein BST61_g8176 [Cercospora zeina]
MQHFVHPNDWSQSDPMPNWTPQVRYRESRCLEHILQVDASGKRHGSARQLADANYIPCVQQATMLDSLQRYIIHPQVSADD